MAKEYRPLAVVTGASSGIGFELARCCAKAGHDLVVVADEPEIQTAATALRAEGSTVETVQADLATEAGVDELLAVIGSRPVALLLANAGRGLGGAFLDQNFADIRHVIDTNVTGALYLIQNVGRGMRDRGQGRILITGSIAGFMPGSFNAVYNGTKAFVDSFSFALRAELEGSGVTVTCLIPGPTDTEFFERADMTDTKIGSGEKDDPADVARDGYEALMAGKERVVSASMKTKVQGRAGRFVPDSLKAKMHREQAKPGSGT
jgi:short-subunit dehydrogenase